MRGVVFIVSDALRADAFERLLSLDLLPNLKRLGEPGTIFTNAYSTTNMTDPSMTTILSGLHPLAHGIVYDADLSPGTVSRGLSTPSIQQLLRPEFRTTAVDLQIPGTWHRRGFDWYVDDVVRTSPSL
jgi:arylsulfatase A-like enzyme